MPGICFSCCKPASTRNSPPSNTESKIPNIEINLIVDPTSKKLGILKRHSLTNPSVSKKFDMLDPGERKQHRKSTSHSQLSDNDQCSLISSSLFVNIINTRPASSDYEIIRVLGEGSQRIIMIGSYGKVFLVRHLVLDQMRAMKVINKDLLGPGMHVELLGETKILMALDHPNIVKIFDIYEDETVYKMVIEYREKLISRYCSGGELFDKIKESSSFSEAQAASLMKQVLSAVQYLHDNKIVHRDIKAENLLFHEDRPDSDLKIIDFGVSTKFLKNQKFNETLGTAYYIAPEVLLQNYNEQCDVWSCGILLFILLCGYPPFNGDSDSEILGNIKIGELEFDGRLWIISR